MTQPRKKSPPCPHCGAEPPPGSRFCPMCGRSLAAPQGRTCAFCSTVAGPDARSCPSCGASLTDPMPDIRKTFERLLPAQYVQKLMAARGSVRGERRIVTILFSDIKGSTNLAERLDPEEVLHIMNGAFEVMIRPIARYEGTLARLMGDGIMAFFGAPIAHEDDPERSCRAALDILEGTKAYARELERDRGVSGFNVRIGINTGLAVVAEVGADARVEYTAMGDAVNLAARMESAAEPGCILITDATYRLVERVFEAESIGKISVKGKSEPVGAHRLIRARETDRDATGKHPQGAPLIGREAELRKVRESLNALMQGTGGLLAIVGDPGIGKSRLVQECRARWFTRGIWAEYRAPAYAQGRSYEGARMLLHSMLGVPGDAEPSSVRDALRSAIAFLAEDRMQEVFPYLSLLFDDGSGEQKGPELRTLDPEVLHGRILRAYSTFVRLHATQQPVMLLVEDLQWFDRSSLDLVESMFPLTREVPLLFLLVYRLFGEPVAAFHKRNSELPEAPYTVVAVPPLTRKESTLLLDTLPGATTLPAPLRQEILVKTEGNPFFIEEVVRQAREREGAVLTVPDTLRGVIMARIDALPQEEQQTLQTASVLGRSFHRRLLVETIKDVLRPESVHASLLHLSQRGFLTARTQNSGASGRSAGDHYMFTHSLTHQVAYDSLLLSQRKVMHRQAGDAIELLHTKDLGRHAAELAEHYEIAGDHRRALRHLLVAGKRAQAVFAHAEAVECYTRAAALADNVGAMPDDLRNIHEGLADAHVIGAEYATALRHYDLALSSAGGGLAAAVLHRKRGTVLEKGGKYDDAVASFEEAVRSLKEEMDLAESARIFNGLARVYCRRRENGAAIEVGLLALDLMQQTDDAWGMAQAYSTLGVASCSAGEMEAGIGYHRKALEIWERLGEQYGIAASLNNLGWAYQRAGDVTRAEEHYRRSITLCEKIGLRHGLASACDNLSQILVLQGNRREATSYLKKAVTILTDIESHEPEPVPELWQQSGTW